MRPRLLLALALCLLAWAPGAGAQIRVQLKLDGDTFLLHEPLHATVQITNLAGRELVFRNEPSRSWLDFQIARNGEDQGILPKYDTRRGFAGVTFPAGQTLEHTVNLTPVYPIQDLGLHSVTATVYCPEMKRYFTSNKILFEVRPGSVLWTQVVGVPEGEGEGLRKYSLLSLRIREYQYLYVRVEEGDGRRVYATRRLGNLLSFGSPQIELDAINRLHILFLGGPQSYAHVITGLNGEDLGRYQYVARQTRPMLRRYADGEVAVVGGEILARRAEPADGSGTPRLSERPPGVPPAE